jgi:diphthamide biosynthesis methyltransferase
MHDDILSYHAYMLMFLLAKFAHMTLQFTFGVLNQLARAFFGEALKVVILFTEPLHFMEKTLAIKLVKHGSTSTFCEVLSVVC